MSDDLADQIHPASPARYERARRDGDFAKSFELAAAVQMLGGILVAFLLFGPLAEWLQELTMEVWSPLKTTESLTQFDPANFLKQMQRLIFSSLTVLAPIGLLIGAFGIVAHWCQTGPMLLTNKAVPDIGRLAPNNWFRRLFSLSTLAYPIISLPKSLLAIGVMLGSCWFQKDSFYRLGSLPADSIVTAIFHLVLIVSAHVTVAMLLASLLDYGMKYLSFQKRIQMTDQQLRDETKMQQGGRR